MLRASTLIVEFHLEGKLRKVTARGFHGLDHLGEVTVRGKIHKDESGNVILIASGMHIKG